MCEGGVSLAQQQLVRACGCEGERVQGTSGTSPAFVITPYISGALYLMPLYLKRAPTHPQRTPTLFSQLPAPYTSSPALMSQCRRSLISVKIQGLIRAPLAM